MVDAARGYLDDIEEDEGGDEAETVEAPTSDRMIASDREDRIPDPPEEEAAGDTQDDDAGDEGEEEAADEAEPEQKATADSPDRPKGFVPEAALAEARNKAREEQQARRRAEETLQRWIDKQLAQEPAKAAEPTEAVEDDPEPAEDDYVGKIAWLERQVSAVKAERAREIADRQAREQEEQKVSQQQQQWDGAVSAVSQYWQAKTAEQPDLAATWEALRINKAQEFVEVNGIQTEKQLLAAVKDWENGIIADCFNNQKPIDQVVRRLAKVRNVTPAQMQQGAAEQNAKADAGEKKPTPPRAENGQFKSEKEKADRIKEGQERNGSLSQASGVPVEKMTAKEFAKMTEDEQHRFLSSISSSKNRKSIERELGFF